MTYSYEGPQDSTRLAIEFLGLWMDHDRPAAAAHITQVLDGPGGPDRNFAIAGLLNLSHFLVAEVANARGASNPQEVDRIAREFLTELSINLPDPDADPDPDTDPEPDRS
ncbi:hypothetical protein DI272_19060 [Streptomyces sp. Act143]|uniref:hypothetical protein n=1 Tax=Streptomyces sp. Act143 TaxID=2200760 RepID=UPI000D6773C9|nr:hypothetical protein [Streptomyces sp. Act143]PWI16033.1 hypothetical protein DI272_19060 [Streptomyces sp. Act143]